MLLGPVLLFLLGLLCCQTTHGAKILIFPFDMRFNSRAINMAKLATYLQDDGHNVSILMREELLGKYRPEHLHIIKYDLPKDILTPSQDELLNKFLEAAVDPSKGVDLVKTWAKLTSGICDGLLHDRELLEGLKAEEYDLFFTDYMNDCGRIIIDYLDVTSILYSNHDFPSYDFIYPKISSIVCDAFSPICSSDEMSFKVRVMNSVFQFLESNMFQPFMLSYFQDLREKYNMNTSIHVSNPVRFTRSIVIINADFVLGYPRPVMPHVFPISGLYDHQPESLPSDLTHLIQQSPFDGIVVVSFGTLVEKVTSEKAEIMARVFGKLPAIVIWRFTGTPPNSLSENTKLVGWFPQYDVLAHPKTKLFISHCGVSASFEAASLGVPVVAVPMMVDQFQHAGQLVNRLKMGVLTDWAQFDEGQFEKDILNVLNNPEFTRNAKKAAELINDRDVNPKQKFLHLVNFTLRHNGAEHLISRPGRELSTLQFYSVDVICFLLLLCALISLLFFRMVRSFFNLFRKFGGKKLKSS